MPPGQWGGLWLLEQLKSRDIRTPVIIVSGEGTQAETIQALRLGAEDYVTKEQLSDELAERILIALQARRTTNEVIYEKIKSGESDTVEFKSTLRINLFTSRSDSAMELACIKTVAGFLNASGGDLLIGITDDGDISGIERDQFPNVDKFQLHFWNLIREAIGTEFSEFIETSVAPLDQGTVFFVSCKPSEKPVFVKWKESGQPKGNEYFYVRTGPQTEMFGMRQALTYINAHFKA